MTINPTHCVYILGITAKTGSQVKGRPELLWNQTVANFVGAKPNVYCYLIYNLPNADLLTSKVVDKVIGRNGVFVRNCFDPLKATGKWWELMKSLSKFILQIDYLIHMHPHIYIYIYIYIKFGWLGLFYDISTFVGYLMPNPIYTYIRYVLFVNK